MSVSDHEYVNFSEDHELDYRLQRVNKRRTADNRQILRSLGQSLKASTGKTRLKHV